MVTFAPRRRFGDLFPSLGPRTLRRVPDDFDDRPYGLFSVIPLGATVGAEIAGLDLRAAQGEALQAELRRALAGWKLLVFRDADIEPAHFYEFARYFGETFDDSTMGKRKQLDDMPNVGVGESTAEQNYWHVDATYGPEPPRATLLRVEAPGLRGDTLFADMGAAYDNLPHDVRAMIAPMRAVHSATDYAKAYHHDEAVVKQRWPDTEHPVVIKHPNTGRPTLYVNGQWAQRIVGLDPDTSDGLLTYLCVQAAVPEYQYRLKWGPGTLAIWDNRALQHYAVSDYVTADRRVRWRTTIRGDRPEPAQTF